jgi:predicted nuclease with TOPRIM domain
MNDHILTAWCVGVIATLAVSAIAAELWRSRERWRNEAEHLRGRCAKLHVENANLREELKRRTE